MAIIPCMKKKMFTRIRAQSFSSVHTDTDRYNFCKVKYIIRGLAIK